MKTRVPVEKTNPEEPHIMEPEDDDDAPRDPSEQFLMCENERIDSGCARAQRDKDGCESENETNGTDCNARRQSF